MKPIELCDVVHSVDGKVISPGTGSSMRRRKIEDAERKALPPVIRINAVALNKAGAQIKQDQAAIDALVI